MPIPATHSPCTDAGHAAAMASSDYAAEAGPTSRLLLSEPLAARERAYEDVERGWAGVCIAHHTKLGGPRVQESSSRLRMRGSEAERATGAWLQLPRNPRTFDVCVPFSSGLFPPNVRVEG